MDDVVLSTATHLLDISKHQQLKTGVKWQLQAPLRFGGHGLTSAVDSAATSYYASVLACSSMPHIQEELQSWSAPDSAPSQPSMLQRDLDECITSMKANITDSRNNLIRTDLLPTSASEIIPHCQQHEKVMPFVQQEVTTISNRLQLRAQLDKADAEGDEGTAARLLAVTAPGASIWLTTDPSSPALSLTNTQYQISSKFRLGLEPLSLPSDCASCHTAGACAEDPNHPLVCIAQKGRDITLRHHGTVDPLYVATIHAGGVAIKEPTHLSDRGDNTRPDLQIVHDGRQYLVDVTIRHPTCKTNIQHGSARHQLAAAHKGEAEKKAKYAAMAKSQQAEFVAFAVETYGGMGKGARKLVKKIASVAQDRILGLSAKEVRRELEQSVAIAVQRGNANIMLAEYGRATSAAARGYRGSLPLLRKAVEL